MFGSGTQLTATEMSVASSLNAPPVKALTSRKIASRMLPPIGADARLDEVDQPVVAELSVPRGCRLR